MLLLRWSLLDSFGWQTSKLTGDKLMALQIWFCATFHIPYWRAVLSAATLSLLVANLDFATLTQVIAGLPHSSELLDIGPCFASLQTCLWCPCSGANCGRINRSKASHWAYRIGVKGEAVDFLDTSWVATSLCLHLRAKDFYSFKRKEKKSRLICQFSLNN